jgi:hypothetical protein
MRSILECHGQLTHDAKIVPTGLQSEQHKRLAMEVRKHSLKAKKVRELGRVTMDPEKQSALTAEARKLTIKRQRREQTLARRNRPAMNIDYLEEGMDEDTSLARIKARTRDRFQTPYVEIHKALVGLSGQSNLHAAGRDQAGRHRRRSQGLYRER